MRNCSMTDFDGAWCEAEATHKVFNVGGMYRYACADHAPEGSVSLNRKMKRPSPPRATVKTPTASISAAAPPEKERSMRSNIAGAAAIVAVVTLLIGGENEAVRAIGGLAIWILVIIGVLVLIDKARGNKPTA